MAETILLHLEYDEAGAREKVIALNVELQKLKKEQASLNQTFRDGTINSEGYARENQRIKEEIKRVTEGIRENEKAIDANQKATKVAAGSLTQMRQQLALMKAAYAELSAEERENAQVGQEHLKAISSLSTKLKELEGAYGDQQRNVDTYSHSLQGLDGSFGKAERAAGLFGINLGTVKNGLEKTKGALELTRTGLTGIKAAIAGTGIGVLVLALGALVNFLTQTQEGMDFVSRKTKGLQAVFYVFSKLVSGFGKAILDAFDNPKNALSDLGDAIKNNLTNRVDAFKKILDAVSKVNLKEIAKGLLQLFTGIKTETIENLTNEALAAAAAGEAVAKANREIEKSERDLNIRTAERRATIEALKKTADDTNESLAEREEAARKASAIEVGLLKEQIALQERKIKNAQADLALGDPNNEEKLRKISEEQVRLEELKADSYGKQTELMSKLNQLREEAFQKQIESELRAANLALEQEQRKLQAFKDRVYFEAGARLDATNQALSLAEREQLVRESMAKDELQMAKDILEEKQRIELINLKREKLSVEESAKQEKAIRARTAQEIAALEKEIQDQALDAREQTEAARARARVIRAELGSDAELAARKRLVEAESDMERTQAARQIKDYTELQARLAEIDAKARRDKFELDKEFYRQFIDQTIETAQAITGTVSTLFEAQIQNATNAMNQQQEAALKSAGNNAELRAAIEEDYQKKREQMEKEGAEKRRKIARAEALINTGVAVTKALTGAPPPFNLILAGISLAQGVAQQVLIDQQQFADGGVYNSERSGPMVKGPGTGTSDSINAKLSNGESVMTARATQMFAPLLSWLNQQGGGRAFPGQPSIGAGYSVTLPDSITHYAAGGVYAPSTPAPEINYDKLASALGTELRANPIITRVVDINTAQSNVQVREGRHDNGFGS